MNVNKKGWLNGSFTIEAAILIPIITIIYIILMYMCFFIYNETICLQEAYAYAVRIGQKQEYKSDYSAQTISNQITNLYSDFLNKSLISSDNRFSNTIVDNDSIVIEYSFDTKSPFDSIMYDWTGFEYFETDNRIQYELFNPVEIVRTYGSVNDWSHDMKEE